MTTKNLSATHIRLATAAICCDGFEAIQLLLAVKLAAKLIDNCHESVAGPPSLGQKRAQMPNYFMRSSDS